MGSNDYKVVDCRWHTGIAFLNDEETLVAFVNKPFEKVDHVNSAMNEVELAKAQIRHEAASFVTFFTLEYAILRMLEI